MARGADRSARRRRRPPRVASAGFRRPSDLVADLLSSQTSSSSKTLSSSPRILNRATGSTLDRGSRRACPSLLNRSCARLDPAWSARTYPFRRSTSPACYFPVVCYYSRRSPRKFCPPRASPCTEFRRLPVAPSRSVTHTRMTSRRASRR